MFDPTKEAPSLELCKKLKVFDYPKKVEGGIGEKFLKP
jgi:hypothetical protein